VTCRGSSLRRGQPTKAFHPRYAAYALGLARIVTRAIGVETDGIARKDIPSDWLTRWNLLVSGGARSFVKSFGAQQGRGKDELLINVLSVLGSVLDDPVGELPALRPHLSRWVESNQHPLHKTAPQPR
jgi:hypothetical protein